MYFEVHVVATEFRRKIISDRSTTLLRFFFLIAATKKIATKQQQRGLNKVKSPIGTRDRFIAATCGQFAARRGEGKAKM